MEYERARNQKTVYDSVGIGNQEADRQFCGNIPARLRRVSETISGIESECFLCTIL